MIYQICDVISISTWDKVHFRIYLLNREVTKLDQLIDISQGNNFQ